MFYTNFKIYGFLKVRF